MIDRRAFVSAMAAGALGAPGWAPAQTAAKLYRIGWLDASSSGDNLGIFVQAMRSRGWIGGKTFELEYRGADGRPDRLATVAADLARLPVDVVVAPGTAEAIAAKKTTASIPIVISGVDDPVARGLVASLARPGGNVTGLATARGELSGKLLSLLREVMPNASSVGVLADATDSDHASVISPVQAAAGALGLTLHLAQVQRHTEVEAAIATVKKQGSQMLVVLMSSMLIPRWIADLSLKYGLPLASTAPGYVYEGGLMSYTADWEAVFDQVASFVDRILKGDKPADLPVELPRQFRLIVNARTARALGITLPQSIALRADNVIE
jgi:putative ABC transport system substrate-binding protein